MAMSQPFTTATQNLISYDFTDVEDGTGVFKYYPMLGRTTAAKYMLQKQLIDSEENGVGVNVGFAKVTICEKTFETGDYTTPRLLKGTGLLILPMDVAPRVSDNVFTIDTTITIKKWNGTIETTIVTITPTQEVTAAGQGLGFPKMVIEMDVPTTNIAAGETIRLYVKVEGQVTAGTAGTSAASVGYSPVGTTFSFVGTSKTTTIADTTMQLNLPFQIE